MRRRSLVLGQPRRTPRATTSSYLPEERGLYKQMPVRRLLRYYGRLKGRSLARAGSGHHALARPPAASPQWADKRIDQLSKGMAQKVQFISRGRVAAEAADSRRAVLRARSRERRGAARRRARAPAPRHHRRLLDARHGRRRKAVRSHLHDLQGPEGARRHARRASSTQYGHDTVRVRLGGGAARARRLPGIESVNDHGNFQDVRLDGRSAGVPARPRRAHRRSSSSRSRSRRCTTSSCASPDPRTRTFARPGRWRDESHPDRR